MKKDGNIFKIFKTTLTGDSFDQVLKGLHQEVQQGKKIFVTTPNPEFLVFAQKHPWFQKILIHSDIAIPDGVALFWAKEVLKKKGFFSRLLVGFWTGLKIIFTGWGEKRITGTDLTEKLCQLAAKNNWTVYFLGGKDDIAQKALNKLQEKYPGLKGWAENGPKLSLTNWSLSLIKEWVEKINQKKPDLFFVALGMGKQEKFLSDNWNQLKIKLGIGIGGAFDYLSGEVKRAPFCLQRIGLEWFYRLIREPWRWKRQLSLVKFIWLVLLARGV
jgi:N-acetylglucosaminyldiphosphoundecaprenol N-acetyl-beta-D-mannosaminyltransferase